VRHPITACLPDVPAEHKMLKKPLLLFGKLLGLHEITFFKSRLHLSIDPLYLAGQGSVWPVVGLLLFRLLQFSIIRHADFSKPPSLLSFLPVHYLHHSDATVAKKTDNQVELIQCLPIALSGEVISRQSNVAQPKRPINLFKHTLM
jgi:hypothetical protein